MYSQFFSRSLAAIVLSLGLLVQGIHADSLEFASPSPNTKIAAGDTVPVTYKVHHNGMAKLLWAKVHFMTEDGYDAGMGTIDTASRIEWQADLKAGNSSKCEGILSEMVPVEIVKAAAVEELEEEDTGKGKKGSLLGLQLRKRSLYAGRDLGVRIGGSDYLLEDGTADTKKMLYFFSLI
ncbi:hypothetical protein KI688_001515 [Linnemannia hyalina]|uniref:Uncharacterized protein n=1 Tax=Linnemannia hyalina TaxID=64524 RepID=A0A9P8BRQ6_9FUNG|nr:hypothetical protein KI688_001515 [Linnemannia hyalina]